MKIMYFHNVICKACSCDMTCDWKINTLVCCSF